MYFNEVALLLNDILMLLEMFSLVIDLTIKCNSEQYFVLAMSVFTHHWRYNMLYVLSFSLITKKAPEKTNNEIFQNYLLVLP